MSENSGRLAGKAKHYWSGKQSKWRALSLAAALLCSAAGFAFAQTPVSPASTAAESVDADCEGVAWPAGFAPETTPVVAPSRRLSPRGQVDFPESRLPLLDVQTLIAEDEAARSDPPRVGIDRQISGAVTGTWHDLADGSRLWTAAVVAPGALSLRLHFSGMSLPPGAAVYVYSPSLPEDVRGPYVEGGLLSTGAFWAGSVEGDTAYVEYQVFDAAANVVPFVIDKVGHMYRDLDGAGGAEPRAWDTCMQDVACYFPTWQNLSYAVAKMTYSSGGSWYNCTGTLLASQAADNTPYFLTSAHCIDAADEASSLQCQWFYQRATCGGSYMTSQYTDVAEVLATSGASIGADWTLLMLRGVLPSGVYWSGWTSTNPAYGSWAVIIHHPNGSQKRYSRGKSYTASADYNHITFNESGSVGAIYYGTSGSSVWTESDQKVFGNASYTAGDPGCDFLSSPAGYGKFSTYYSTISGYLAAGSDDAFEPNDTCATASPVGAGSYSNLVVKRYGADGAQGEDWYRLSVAAATVVSATLTFTNAYGNINAQLYNTCGGSVVASASGTGNSETVTYNNTGPAAMFYLRVYLANTTRNTYNMTVSGAFADCNSNLKNDACDISCAAPGCSGVPGCGSSLDCNNDGVPDECQGGDPCPPSPNPPAWVVVPTPLSTSSVTMQAQATDPAGVEYTFGATGISAHSRGWAASGTYTDTGLDTNRSMTYKVKARDLSALHNETAYTSPYPVATMIETPTGLSFGAVTDTTIQVTALDTFTRATDNLSGLYFQVTKLDGTPVGGGQANNWVQLDPPPLSITATGLSPGTQYRFRVKARNYYAVETPWYPASDYVLQSTTGGATCTRRGDVNQDGRIDGLDIAGFVRAKLGSPPGLGENPACANYGGAVEQDIAAFVADLLG